MGKAMKRQRLGRERAGSAYENEHHFQVQVEIGVTTISAQQLAEAWIRARTAPGRPKPGGNIS
jgi:hypothetical protein